nr:group II intron reverse transcriptase/maturase [Dictyobacter vulcani]
MRKDTIIHRAEMLNDSNFSIVAAYQSEFRGIANYYRLAYNLHTLNKLKYVMDTSLTKTLAHKNKVTVSKIYARYKADIQIGETLYKGLRVTVPRKDKKPLVAIWGGISLKWDIKATIEEHKPGIWTDRTELEKRLLAEICEYCGSTEKVEGHHIRAMKDLNKYTGREKPNWVKRMAELRRKTMFLCRNCHMDLHAGKPMVTKMVTLTEVKALQKAKQ